MEFSQLPNTAEAKAPVAPKVEPPKAEEPKAEEKKGEQALPVADGQVTSASIPDNPVAQAVNASKRKYKVAGKEVELSDDEATAAIQKALYADQQIKEAAQLKKMVHALTEKLKNPGGLKEILSDPSIGVDYKKWAIETVKEMMEEEQLDPRDRKLREYERAEAARKEQEEMAQKQAEEQAAAQKREMTRNVLRNEIIDALKSSTVLPTDADTFDRIILRMRAAYKTTGKVLSASQAVKDVEEMVYNTTKHVLSKSQIDKIAEILGPEAAQKLKDAELAKFKKADADKLAGKDDKAKKMPYEVNKKGRVRERDINKNWKNIIAGL